MNQLEESRYPFESAFEFFGSYWRDLAALHLDFAFICALLLAFRMLLARGSLGRKLLALYFGLTMFNNPAFQLVTGATLGDILGVFCVLYYGLRVLRNQRLKVRLSPVGFPILCAGLVLTFHAFLVSPFYPALNSNGAGLTRSLVLLKIFVLGFCCCMFEEYIEDQKHSYWLIRQVVNFALIGIAAYVVQIAVLLSGTLPYGTFLDAGYVGFPAFGSVSIERGHFGKFMTPLFPLFFLLFLKQRQRVAFLGFALVTIVNFSASSLSYFAFYVANTTVQFRVRLLKLRYAVLASGIIAALCIFTICTWSLWVGLATKMNDQAVEGEGGRSFGLVIAYLQNFPMGLSYGGSSLRTAPGFDEMNSGLYSFIAQTSVLALPLIGAFLWLVYTSVRKCDQIPDLYSRRALKTGVMIMPFIFFSDVLWFVPTIWLPMLLVYRLSRFPAARPGRTVEKLPQLSPILNAAPARY